MRVVVTGATGLLGSATADALARAGHDVVACLHTRPAVGAHPTVPLDVTDRSAVRRAVSGADAVVHAAYRRRGPGSRAVNVDGSRWVAEECRRAAAVLLHISSDVVFPGRPPRPEGYREADPTGPVEGFAYGREKADAEAAVRSACPDAVVVRTTLLYDLAGTSPLEQMVVRSAAPGSAEVHFTDEHRSPVHVEDVAVGLVALLALDAARRPPVVHLGGPTRLDRLEIARRLAPHLGVDPADLGGGSSSGAAAGPRPADLTLDSSLAAELLGYRPRPL